MRRDPARFVLVALCCVGVLVIALAPLGAMALLAVLPVVLALLALTETRRFAPVLVPLPVSLRFARTSAPRAPPLS